MAPRSPSAGDEELRDVGGETVPEQLGDGPALGAAGGAERAVVEGEQVAGLVVQRGLERGVEEEREACS